MATIPVRWTLSSIDALADELHDLLCRQLFVATGGLDPQARDKRHREVDLGRARFIAIGLAGRGWYLDHAQRRTPTKCTPVATDD